jgi:PAS domain S-box-containing protein
MMVASFWYVLRSRLVRRLLIFTVVVICLSLFTRYSFLRQQQQDHVLQTAQQQLSLLIYQLNQSVHQPAAMQPVLLTVLFKGYTQQQAHAQLIVFNQAGQTVMLSDRPDAVGQPRQLPTWHAKRHASLSLVDQRLVAWQPLSNGYWLYVQHPLQQASVPLTFWLHAMSFPVLLSLLYLAALILPLGVFFDRLRQLISFSHGIDEQDHHVMLPLVGQTNELSSLNHALNRLSYRYHRKQEQVQQLRGFQSILIDASPDILLRTDHQGRISFITSSFERSTGLAREQVLGQPISHVFAPIAPAPDNALTLLHRLTQHVRLVVRLSGRDRLYDLWLNPVRNEHGQLTGYGGVLHDVTHYKHEISQLQSSRDAVQVRLTENERMLATMSHELRTPLNGILGMAQLLRETELDTEQSEYARTLYNSGQAMLRLVNDILDLSKLDAGKMQTEQLDFDLLELSIEICDLMAASASQKSLELINFIDPNTPRFLQGDPYRIRQILLNLINNAIKFTEIGYVAVHIAPVAADHPDVVDLLPLIDPPNPHSAACWLMFEVNDSGVGIPHDRQQDLFQFFAQADRSVSRRFGGTGLGLAISRGLAEAMNGRITLSSEPNQGTSFRLYLPFIAQIETSLYHRPTQLAQLAIEVFEPIDVNRQGLTCLFESLDIHAELHDDLSGLATAAEHAALIQQPMILLIDYELLDDRPLADYLHPYPSLRQAHCILLSRRSRRSIPARMIEGFEGFVFKPIRVEHLLAELLRAVDDESLPDRPAADSQKAMMDAFFAQVKQEEASQPVSNVLALRVLLAEDNIVNQKVATKMLQKLGCEVTLVENGQQAVDFLATGTPVDLVLMDCRMPEMDGLEATRTIRRQMNSIPIIALTANDTEEDREDCMNAGMDEFLPKPLDQQALAVLIARFRLLRQ